MKIVVFGLSLSSSWGNGHATTYRALLRALAERGHEVLFLERDAPWYAAHRDLEAPDFCRLALYGGLAELETWRDDVRSADAVIVGSYVPDGVAVGHWALDTARGPVAFYDIDTPVTLAGLEAGETTYVSAALIRRYPLYLSFTGGPTLNRLMSRYGSPMARALYCCVDERAYRPRPQQTSRWDLTYLGTYSPDRQPTLQRLLIDAARQAPSLRFAVAGPQYPDEIGWPANVERFEHVPPADHPAFYAAGRFTLNVTRRDMIAAGWSPSVRLFEAAACQVPILSDSWPGLDSFFRPGREILTPSDARGVVEILASLAEAARAEIAEAARTRVLEAHTATRRAAELEQLLLEAAAGVAGARTSMTPLS